MRRQDPELPMSPEPRSSAALDALFDDLPTFLKPDEVAVLLRYESTQGVHKLLRERVMPGFKVAGRWVIQRDELKAWIEAGSNTSQTEQAPPKE